MSVLVQIPGFPTLCLDRGAVTGSASVLRAAHLATGLPEALLLLPSGWTPAPASTDSSSFPELVSVRLRGAGLLGGKGGFGSLLKATSARIGTKRTTNFSACRDLSGRRLRHVEAAKQLEEWNKKKPGFSRAEVIQMFKEAKSGKRPRRPCKYGDKCKYQSTTCKDEHPADRARRDERFRQTHLSTQFGDPNQAFHYSYRIGGEEQAEDGSRSGIASSVQEGLRLRQELLGKRKLEQRGDQQQQQQEVARNEDEGGRSAAVARQSQSEEEEDEVEDDDELFFYNPQKRARTSGSESASPMATETEEEAAAPADDWQCDGCSSVLHELDPRFRCLVCDDFDYCAHCHAVHGESHKGADGVTVHELMLISGPGAVPIAEFLRRLGLDFPGIEAPPQQQQQPRASAQESHPEDSSSGADQDPSPIAASAAQQQPKQQQATQELPALPDLSAFASAEALLEAWGGDRLKQELQRLGLKASGRPADRATLLFSTKGLKELTQVPRQHFAKGRAPPGAVKK